MNLRPPGYEPDELPAALLRDVKLVPRTGVEPVRYRYRGILSPVRLPIPPSRHSRSAELIWERLSPLPKVAPEVGLEPTAYRLTAGCSTIELLRNSAALATLLLYAEKTGLVNTKIEISPFLFESVKPGGEVI